MKRSKEYYQGDRVVHGFPRSPRGGWSHREAGRWRKIEELSIYQNQSADSAVIDRPNPPEPQRCGFNAQESRAFAHEMPQVFGIIDVFSTTFYNKI